jgi:hypothetical protein
MDSEGKFLSFLNSTLYPVKTSFIIKYKGENPIWKKNQAQPLMMDKTTQKGFREREWIKKEVSYKPVSQTGRVGTSPLSGGWGLKGDTALLAVGFLPLINVLMKFNLSNAGPRLSCKDRATARSERARERAGKETGQRTARRFLRKTSNCVFYVTLNQVMFSPTDFVVVFTTWFPEFHSSSGFTDLLSLHVYTSESTR